LHVPVIRLHLPIRAQLGQNQDRLPVRQVRPDDKRLTNIPKAKEKEKDRGFISASRSWLSAGFVYRSQAAKDNGLAAHGITTTAVISTVFHRPLTLGTSGANPSYTLYAVAAFTTASGPAHAQVALENCSGVCRVYRDGQQLTITYDSQNPANAVAGRSAGTALHLNIAIVFAAVMGVVFLFAAVVNLLVGV
jgi:hypothetical protein